MWRIQAWRRILRFFAGTATWLTIITMQNLEQCYVGKPDAAKVACPVWRGLGGNVLRKEQRAALPPYGTQLLNAGCRVTSIQRFLGHKKLSTTMVYARANDKNVAQDYFSAMERVEKRLDLGSEGQKSEKNGSIVNVQGQKELFEITEQLARPVLSDEERLALVGQLREALGVLN